MYAIIWLVPEWLDKIYPRKILGAEPSALEITTGIVGATI